MFDFLIIQPITNILILLYIGLGENLGLAIVIFTIALRFILLPLTIRQLKIQKRLQELQPTLQELQAKRKSPDKITPEEMALMKEVSSSCLGILIPFLIQIPILIGLYRVITEIASVNVDVNKGGDFFNNILYFNFLKHESDYRFNTNFLGIDLASIPSNLNWDFNFIPYLLLIALLVITQYLQSKLFISKQTKANPKKKSNQKKLSKEELERLQIQESMNRINNMQMLYMVPALIGFGAYSFYAALSVYWLTQNIFSLIQTLIQFKFVEIKGYVNKLKVILNNRIKL